MLAQYNALFFTSAIVLSHLFLETQGLALPVSTQHVSRNVNTTISDAMNTQPTTANLAQRDIPAPVMNLLNREIG
ncbi:hypothetical protein VP01_1833g6 [Puccinia sorghi]|uniref:Uncharacterized protein n=1 Tax=Puccinia sorghi TaxID=27349 RepID=A0A0L6VEE6_9BASI|nr:hypothetical protein VP01_1833g6 [Puccinia sorghi]